MSSPRIFISYSHDSEDHRGRVRELANRLRGDGVDAWIDQFEVSPPEGFAGWMQRQIEEAGFVLAICTATYRRRFEGKEEPGKGRGVTWEGLIAIQMLYDDSALNTQWVPVLFADGSDADVPIVLKRGKIYQLPDDYTDLLRRLHNQPQYVPAPLGTRPDLSPHDDCTVGSDGLAETIDGVEQRLLELPYKEAKREWQNRFDRAYINNVLQRTAGNVSRAADVSKVDRRHIQRLMKRFNVRNKVR